MMAAKKCGKVIENETTLGTLYIEAMMTVVQSYLFETINRLAAYGGHGKIWISPKRR
jgi:hypothetical protein